MSNAALYVAAGWLLLTAVAVAAADTGNCLTPFANAAADSENLGDLAVEAYRNLWDRLGRSATPEVLKEIERTGDPFAISEAMDLSALKKHLGEFERMLASKESNTSAVRARLLGELSARRQRLADDARVKQAALDRMGPDTQLPFTASEVQISPDGQWAAFYETPVSPSVRPELTIQNLRTGKQHTQVPVGLKDKKFRFTPDGAGLLFATQFGPLQLVPFVDGVPDYAHESTIGLPRDLLVQVERLEVGKDPTMLYSVSNRDVTEYNLATKSARVLALPNTPGQRVSSLQVFPGEPGIFLRLVSDSGGSHNGGALYGPDADGVLQKTKAIYRDVTMGQFNDPRRALAVSAAKGSWIYLDRDNMVYEQSGQGTPRRIAVPIKGIPFGKDVRIDSVDKRPGHDQLVVTYLVKNEPFVNGEYTVTKHLRFWDIHTGELLHTRELPPFVTNVSFTPNGEKLISIDQKAKKLLILNPDRPGR